MSELRAETPRADHVVVSHREPLPLPRHRWGAADALAALEEARPLLGVGAVEPVVVSALTTVVLRCADHAVKVYPVGTDATHLDQVRHALAGVPEVVVPSAAPVVTEHGVVTVMPWVPGGATPSWGGLGAVLRRFHDATTGLVLPAWNPLARLPGQVVGLPPEQAAVLLGARAELLTALDAATSALGVGPIHGDVSPWNAVRTPSGARLIDLDWVASAPRENDLAAAARRRATGELDRSAYADFCRAYGADVRGWDGLPLLDRVAELDRLAFCLWDSRHHGRDLGWLDAELRRWRTPC